MHPSVHKRKLLVINSSLAYAVAATCMAMSIDTGSALARFIGQLRRNTHLGVGMPQGSGSECSGAKDPATYPRDETVTSVLYLFKPLFSAFKEPWEMFKRMKASGKYASAPAERLWNISRVCIDNCIQNFIKDLEKINGLKERRQLYGVSQGSSSFSNFCNVSASC